MRNFNCWPGRRANTPAGRNPTTTQRIHEPRRRYLGPLSSKLQAPSFLALVLRLGRVPGADLMVEICRRSAEMGHLIFLYEASEDVNRDAVTELRRRFPQIKIVGRANGYVRPEQMEALVDEINESEADILFIALGSPPEQWISKYADVLQVDLCLGIGGTLDTIVGKVPPPRSSSGNSGWSGSTGSPASRAASHGRSPCRNSPGRSVSKRPCSCPRTLKRNGGQRAEGGGNAGITTKDTKGTKRTEGRERR